MSVETASVTVHVRSFVPGDEVAFRNLNEEWLTKLVVLEDADRAVLEDPAKNIVESGGHIFIALAEDRPIGCCALLRVSPAEFELAKMAVLEEERGRGIGRKMLQHAIAQAKTLGAKRLYLETNRKLANAIHLYESVGFQHVPREEVIPRHTIANVFMRMEL